MHSLRLARDAPLTPHTQRSCLWCRRRRRQARVKFQYESSSQEAGGHDVLAQSGKSGQHGITDVNRSAIATTTAINAGFGVDGAGTASGVKSGQVALRAQSETRVKIKLPAGETGTKETGSESLDFGDIAVRAPPLRHLSKTRPKGPKKRLPSRRHASSSSTEEGGESVRDESVPVFTEPSASYELHATTSVHSAPVEVNLADGDERLQHLTKSRPPGPPRRRPTRRHFRGDIDINGIDTNTPPRLSAEIGKNTSSDTYSDGVGVPAKEPGVSTTDDGADENRESLAPSKNYTRPSVTPTETTKQLWGVALGGVDIGGSSSTDQRRRSEEALGPTLNLSQSSELTETSVATTEGTRVQLRPKKNQSVERPSQNVATSSSPVKLKLDMPRETETDAFQSVPSESGNTTPLINVVSGHAVAGRYAQPAPASRDSILDDAFDFTMFEPSPSPEMIAENQFREIYESDENVLTSRRDSVLELWAELGEVSPT